MKKIVTRFRLDYNQNIVDFSPTINDPHSLHKQVGPGCFVCGLELPGRWSNLLVDQGKLDLGIMELLSALPLAKLGRDSGSLDDLDAVAAHPVAGGHLGVHLLNAPVQSGVTVLLVHVVIPSSALVSQPDAVVLDGCRVLLENLSNRNGNMYYFR